MLCESSQSLIIINVEVIFNCLLYGLFKVFNVHDLAGRADCKELPCVVSFLNKHLIEELDRGLRVRYLPSEDHSNLRSRAHEQKDME
jgi:hypothetical protein